MLKKVAMIIMALTIFVSGGMYSQNANAIAKHKNYSGEQIYLGIMFGQGKLAKAFPEIWTKENLAKANKKEVKQFTSLIVKDMKKQDTSYFKDLQNAVYSKNVVKIDKTLAESGPLLDKAMKHLGFKVKQQNKKEGTGAAWVVSLAGVYTTVGAVATAGVAVSLVVGLGVAAVNTAYVYNKTKYWGAPSTKSNQLQKEQFITELIEAVQ